MTLERRSKQSPELKEAYDTEETTHDLIETAFTLEDLTRNASGALLPGGYWRSTAGQSAASEARRRWRDCNPVFHGAGGDLGLFEDGFSWAQDAAVIRNTCEMAQKTRGIQVPIDDLPLDDPKTYDLLNQGKHAGHFSVGIQRDARFVP